MKPRSPLLVPPKTLADQIADRVRASIISGEYTLGSLIAEEALAGSFGVSRTPVRQALNLLQVEGLVNILPQRGNFVFEPDEQDIVELTEFRSQIEPGAARLAYSLNSQVLVATLGAAVDEMQAAREAKDPLRSSNADTEFHEALVRHCGNRYMQAAYSLVSARIASLRNQLPRAVDVLSQDGIDQHRALLTALTSASWSGFDKLLRKHVADSCSGYLSRLAVLRQSR